MVPMTQALAEYVSITASSARAIMGSTVRNVVQFGSDHFVAVIVSLVLFVLVVMGVSSARR